MNEQTGISSLSRRELEIAMAYANGDGHGDIAVRLCIAPTTVRTHLQSIYRKLEISSKIDLLRTIEANKEDRQTPIEGQGLIGVPDEPSIAILPFQNLSGEEEQAYFSSEITEDITTGLARFHGLKVVARNSSFVYRNTAIDIREVGRALGASYVVEGSVRKTGNQVHITVQLIDAGSGYHLWAEHFDREVQDILAVQDEITETIISHLAIRVEDGVRDRSKRKRPSNLVAYDLVLRGDEEILEYTKERSDRAKAYYCSASELDPAYARAYAGIAFAHLSDWGFLWSETPDEALDLAVEYARKAVTLDDAESRAHWVLAYVLAFHQDYEKARFHQKRALALNPNDADILAKMGFVLPILGEHQEAIEIIRRAMRLNPHFPAWYNTFLGIALFAARQYDDAVAALNDAANAYPEDKAWMAAALAQQGNFVEAKRLVETFVKSAGAKPWWSHVPDTAESVENDPTGLLTYMVYMNPYKDHADREHLLDSLRSAGL